MDNFGYGAVQIMDEVRLLRSTNEALRAQLTTLTAKLAEAEKDAAKYDYILHKADLTTRDVLGFDSPYLCYDLDEALEHVLRYIKQNGKE